MDSGWKIGTDEQRQALLMRIRNVALTALQQYDMDWTEIKFNKLSDAITFKIITETKDCFLQRIHNNNRKKQKFMAK